MRGFILMKAVVEAEAENKDRNEGKVGVKYRFIL